jgi:GTPase SAR1 family protein
MSDQEQQFMQAAETAVADARELRPLLAQMHDWQTGLRLALAQAGLATVGLSGGSPLAQQAQCILADLATGEREQAARWASLAPAQALAGRFDDKVMLLVFGKFNAGKSSLCNFLAERFRQQGHKVQYFHLAQGQLVDTDEAFQEGSTETTARLQGVCLGERLVLLDTPGLHSATGDNAALTQRFLDSADAVLWLTSSTSPGQVQELDELARELRRGKPLLPVVTRSDCIEEDEVNGAIVKQLRNKSAANRALQEEDVQARARDKLAAMGIDRGQLKPPVSLSVHVAMANGQTVSALHEAGLDRLYASLLALVAPALVYRQRKPAEVLLHHLQEDVLGTLNTRTLPSLNALLDAIGVERTALVSRQARLCQMSWRDVIAALPACLEAHAPRRDVRAVCVALATSIETAVAQQMDAALDAYIRPILAPVKVSLPAGVTYETEGIDEGDAAAVGYDKLYSALTHAVQEILGDLAARAVSACEDRLAMLEARAQRLTDIVAAHEQRLVALAQVLRSEGHH